MCGTIRIRAPGVVKTVEDYNKSLNMSNTTSSAPVTTAKTTTASTSKQSGEHQNNLEWMRCSNIASGLSFLIGGLNPS